MRRSGILVTIVTGVLAGMRRVEPETTARLGVLVRMVDRAAAAAAAATPNVHAVTTATTVAVMIASVDRVCPPVVFGPVRR